MNNEIIYLASHSLVVDGIRINKMFRLKICGSKILKLDEFDREMPNTIFVNKEIILESLDGSFLNHSLSCHLSIEEINNIISSRHFKICYKI